MKLDILVIDRKRDVVDSITGVLNQAGFSVRGAWTLPGALAALRARAPTIIVAHSTVPSESHEDADILQVLAQYPSALVITSSGRFSDIHSIPAKAVRLAKPFGKMQLLDAIKEALARNG